MNTTDIGKALNLAGSGVELEQAIIRFPPTVEVAGLLILQLVFNPVVLELLDSVGDPCGSVLRDPSWHPKIHPSPFVTPSFRVILT